MYAQHKKEIPPPIPKHSFDDHKIYTVRKNIILSFTSLLTATEKKPRPTATIIFLSLPFAKKNHLDTCKYRQIQISGTSKLYSNY